MKQLTTQGSALIPLFAGGPTCVARLSFLFLIITQHLPVILVMPFATPYLFKLQAQGLVRLIGGAEVIAKAVQEHGIVLAAHGPYSAAGASEVLGCPVDCVNRDFASFDGLVVALEQAFA